jgi:hypothetical protein
MSNLKPGDKCVAEYDDGAKVKTVFRFWSKSKSPYPIVEAAEGYGPYQKFAEPLLCESCQGHGWMSTFDGSHSGQCHCAEEIFAFPIV